MQLRSWTPAHVETLYRRSSFPQWEDASALTSEVNRVGGAGWDGRSVTTNLNTTRVQSEPHLKPGALKQTTTGHRYPQSPCKLGM